MRNVYFVNQAYHNKTNDTWSKGFVIKADPNTNNEEAALQTYHAYLGAYAYVNNADIDYVYCRVSAANNAREPIEEEWEELHTPPVVEPEET